MKIHGKAKYIEMLAEGELRHIEVGNEWDGQEDGIVTELFIALEGAVAFVRVTVTGEIVYYFSAVNAVINVQWSEMPDIHSNTEWGMWAAEAAGYMAFKGAYDPSKPLPDHLKQFKRVLPVKTSIGNVPPALKVILPAVTSANAVVSTPISGKKARVDSDAGGPPGLDIDAEEGLEDVNPVRIQVARERISRDGQRFLLVNSGDYPADVIRERGYVYDGKSILKVADVNPDDESNMTAIRVV